MDGWMDGRPQPGQEGRLVGPSCDSEPQKPSLHRDMEKNQPGQLRLTPCASSRDLLLTPGSLHDSRAMHALLQQVLSVAACTVLIPAPSAPPTYGTRCALIYVNVQPHVSICVL